MKAAADMDEIVEHENPPIFQDFFIVGRTANTEPHADLVLWNATIKPPKINIHIVSAHANFIACLKEIVLSHKTEQEEEQKLPTIQELINTAGQRYTSGGLSKKTYARRMANIQKITRANGSAEWNDENMKEGMFLSCPEMADIAVKLMAKYPAHNNKNDFPLEHFETLLKEDQYQGPYVIVQEKRSREFFQALAATAKTGDNYIPEWGALEIPQKSYFQQAREFLFD